MRISYSQFATYRRCPHLYRLRYVDRIPAPVGPALHFGAAIHDALHRMYDPRQLQRPSLEEVVEAFIRSWRGRQEQIPEETRQAYFDQGVSLLQGHYEKYSGSEEGRRTAATELQFSVGLPGDHTVMGRIDRVDVVGDHALEVIDYKTSRSMPPVTTVEKDAQLAIYRMAAEELYPDFEVTTTLFFLLHDHQMRVKQRREFKDEIRAELLDMIVSVDLEEFDPTPGTHCDWCDYREHCRLFRTPQEPEDLQIDIAAALREYADAGAAERDCKKRKDAAQKLIHQYLDVCQTERVESGGYVCDRRQYQRTTSWDVDRLREILSPLGKWDDVTQVNTSALKQILKSEDISREQRKAIEALAQHTESTSLRVKLVGGDDDIEERGE